MDGKYWDKGLQLVYGCSHVSPGCDHCWAERMAHIFGAGTDGCGRWNGGVWCDYDAIDKICSWTPHKRPTRCCVWNDLHHEGVPDKFIDAAYRAFASQPRHRFMVLTKRASRMRAYWGDLLTPYNVALGVTVESQDYACRLDDLCAIDCGCRFVSVEPMLGPVDLRAWLMPSHSETVPAHAWGCDGTCRNCPVPEEEEVQDPPMIHWVICGGETGPGARPVNPQWVRDLRDQCIDAGVPFWLKGWGEWAPIMWCGDDSWHLESEGIQLSPLGKTINDIKWPMIPVGGDWMARVGRKRAGRLLDGREWNHVPKVLEV